MNWFLQDHLQKFHAILRRCELKNLNRNWTARDVSHVPQKVQTVFVSVGVASFLSFGALCGWIVLTEVSPSRWNYHQKKPYQRGVGSTVKWIRRGAWHFYSRECMSCKGHPLNDLTLSWTTVESSFRHRPHGRKITTLNENNGLNLCISGRRLISFTMRYNMGNE